MKCPMTKFTGTYNAIIPYMAAMSRAMSPACKHKSSPHNKSVNCHANERTNLKLGKNAVQ